MTVARPVTPLPAPRLDDLDDGGFFDVAPPTDLDTNAFIDEAASRHKRRVTDGFDGYDDVHYPSKRSKYTFDPSPSQIRVHRYLHKPAAFAQSPHQFVTSVATKEAIRFKPDPRGARPSLQLAFRCRWLCPSCISPRFPNVRSWPGACSPPTTNATLVKPPHYPPAPRATRVADIRNAVTCLQNYTTLFGKPVLSNLLTATLTCLDRIIFQDEFASDIDG